MAESGGEGTTSERFDVTVLEKESPLPAGWLLLEETERRQDDTGGSYETEGTVTFRRGRNNARLGSRRIRESSECDFVSIESQVQGVECIYGCYVHSAILPTFHRRCYWLLQNPDVVLVHYLNVPYPDGDAKLAALPPCLALPPDKKEWTRDELASQLRPMFLGGDDDPNNPHLTQHSNHPVDMIVSQLLDRQRASSTTSTTSTQLAPRRLTPDNQVSVLLVFCV